MPLKLYSNFVNSAGERVRIALALKGVAYEYVSVRDIGYDAYKKLTNVSCSKCQRHRIQGNMIHNRTPTQI